MACVTIAPSSPPQPSVPSRSSEMTPVPVGQCVVRALSLAWPRLPLSSPVRSQREAGWAELHGLFSLESSSWPARPRVGQAMGRIRPLGGWLGGHAAAPPLASRSAQLHGDAACS